MQVRSVPKTMQTNPENDCAQLVGGLLGRPVAEAHGHAFAGLQLGNLKSDHEVP
jgi:hypothetical protein